MLTRLSEFLRKHEPVTKLLMRLALLAILICVALDFHYLSLSVGDIAGQVEQIQADLSDLVDNVSGTDDSADAPTKLSTPLKLPI